MFSPEEFETAVEKYVNQLPQKEAIKGTLVNMTRSRNVLRSFYAWYQAENAARLEAEAKRAAAKAKREAKKMSSGQKAA
jgi:hypothetical protein